MDRLKLLFFLALVVLLLVIGSKYSPGRQQGERVRQQAVVPDAGNLSAAAALGPQEALRAIKVSQDEHAAAIRDLSQRIERLGREIQQDREKTTEVIRAVVNRIEQLATPGGANVTQPATAVPDSSDTAMELIRGLINVQQQQKISLENLVAEIEELKKQLNGLEAAQGQAK